MPAAADPVPMASCAVEPAPGERTLCHEAIVAAPVAEVWRLWSISEGLASWVAPVAAIDLRVGGIWEASYDRNAVIGAPGNIRNRVLSYAPERMLSIAVDSAPPNFPHRDLVGNLWTVIELEPVNAQTTRVRVAMYGYGAGDGYDALYAHFDRGNAWTLQQLEARVREGPRDWNSILAPSAGSQQ
jgi:uncharacterized protein YndB with AHSA1/START domain